MTIERYFSLKMLKFLSLEQIFTANVNLCGRNGREEIASTFIALEVEVEAVVCAFITDSDTGVVVITDGTCVSAEVEVFHEISGAASARLNKNTKGIVRKFQ
jgi:hypothetical protein